MMRALGFALLFASSPANAEVAISSGFIFRSCDTCGSIALQGPLDACANSALCFSALLQVHGTISAAQTLASSCNDADYATRAAALSSALTAYLTAYQGSDILATLSQWQHSSRPSTCDPSATEAQIDTAIHTLTHLFTFGCDGALPRSEARVADLPTPYAAAPTPEIAVC